MGTTIMTVKRVFCWAISPMCLLALVACSEDTTPDLKAALTRDPERLRAELRACRDDPKRAGEERCRVVADAWRERFLGTNASTTDTTPLPEPGSGAAPPPRNHQRNADE
jgi:hypothetical protein